MDKRYFSDKVVKWYDQHKRDLPWRDTRDPYKIWLSEIILQQTRVNQGLPYYLKFVERFPDVASLASATEQEVLRLWQGLGYYTRARNLHKCAKEVVSSHGAVFPQTFEALKKLIGIGDYTAAAIASIAFRQSVAVVDGNVFRVLSRVFGIEQEVSSPEGRRTFTILANELIKGSMPDLHNQAVMEFGALFCTPKNPDCSQCVFLSTCFAAQKNLQHLLPVKAKTKVSRKRYFYYFVIQKGNALLMKKRGERDIWHGLFDFFLVEKTKPVPTKKLVEDLNSARELNLDPNDVEVSHLYKHLLSHQIILAKFIIVKEQQAKLLLKEPFALYKSKDIGDLPKPVLISRFLADYQLL